MHGITTPLAQALQTQSPHTWVDDICDAPGCADRWNGRIEQLFDRYVTNAPRSSAASTRAGDPGAPVRIDGVVQGRTEADLFIACAQLESQMAHDLELPRQPAITKLFTQTEDSVIESQSRSLGSVDRRAALQRLRELHSHAHPVAQKLLRYCIDELAGRQEPLAIEPRMMDACPSSNDALPEDISDDPGFRRTVATWEHLPAGKWRQSHAVPIGYVHSAADAPVMRIRLEDHSKPLCQRGLAQAWLDSRHDGAMTHVEGGKPGAPLDLMNLIKNFAQEILAMRYDYNQLLGRLEQGNMSADEADQVIKDLRWFDERFAQVRDPKEEVLHTFHVAEELLMGCQHPGFIARRDVAERLLPKLARSIESSGQAFHASLDLYLGCAVKGHRVIESWENNEVEGMIERNNQPRWPLWYQNLRALLIRRILRSFNAVDVMQEDLRQAQVKLGDSNMGLGHYEYAVDAVRAAGLNAIFYQGIAFEGLLELK